MTVLPNCLRCGEHIEQYRQRTICADFIIIAYKCPRCEVSVSLKLDSERFLRAKADNILNSIINESEDA